MIEHKECLDYLVRARCNDMVKIILITGDANNPAAHPDLYCQYRHNLWYTSVIWPENFLITPRSQQDYINAMVELGSYRIIESYSDPIYNTLRLAILEKRLDIGDLAIFFVDMQNKVTEIFIDDIGCASGSPKGFFDSSDNFLDDIIVKRGLLKREEYERENISSIIKSD
jgi:hypothetical protein